MNENLKDILSHLHSEVDQETLLKYLQGKLSPEEQHEVEKNMLADEFEAEALDGLQGMENKGEIAAVVEQLNRDLKKKTTRKRSWLFKREAKVDSLVILTIVIFLLLIILSYIVIRNMGAK